MTTSPDLRFLLRHPAHLLAMGFGSGLASKAPGTFGSLAAIPLFLLFPAWPLAWMLALLALLFLLGVWCCGVTGRALGVSDHGGIVWDEMVAMWLILALVPRTLFWFAAAFALFRLFDIWKPFPIRQFDARLKGGFGVMFDDLLAAGYALAGLKALQWLMTHS
ncbi:MAG TPA: phosphatidylglycerophosphatase A [Methylophilaceae bacterium]|nr:phosphatidylglycerophosphatase A [Methylophilaceae bacterium]